MSSLPTDVEPPFWVDDPDPYQPHANRTSRVAEGIGLGLVFCFRVGWLLAVLWIAVLVARKYPLVWIFLAFEAGFILLLVVLAFASRRRIRRRPSVAEVQRLAKARTGAEVIGSALHTAGHPLLQVNQPVVLGLKGDELSIYSYSTPNPIDTINVRDIQSVQTVVLNDDGVPHANVVDNTAQALQLTASWQGRSYTCSFRRLYKVRAIEWYQALHAARLLGDGKTNS